MFEACLKQGSILKKLVDAIKDLANEANWEVDANGIHMQAMDSSHVCLIAFDLEASKFDRYVCTENRYTFGVNLGNLAKILKCASSDDAITMKLDANKEDTLLFIFESIDRISEFSLKLMQIDCEQLGIPDGTEYDVVAELPSTDFGRIVRDMGSIGETLTVFGGDRSLKFSTSGDIGTASMTLKGKKPEDDPSDSSASTEPSEPTNTISLKVNADTTLSFSSRYLVSFSKGSVLSSSVTLSMSKESPMCIEYTVGGDVGTLKYYLAPKIDEDDEVVVVESDD